MKKNIGIFIIIASLLSGMLIGGACAETEQVSGENENYLTFAITENKEFGSALLMTSSEELALAGFEYGDSIDVVFSNGYTLEDIPFYNGYNERVGKPLMVDYSGVYICIAFCSGDPLWYVVGCAEGDTVDIRIREKGKYLDIQEALDTVYSDERAHYESDEAFSNFRPISCGSMKADTFYRGASPLDDQRNRARITDSLLEKTGIGFVLDLADTDEKILAYTEYGEYARQLYNDGKLYPVGLSASYRTDTFKEKLIGGLRVMMTQDGPYYIHCTEGKDRTGFVCMLLEALAGASADELEQDYMETYDCYYGINEESQPAKYDAIRKIKFYDMLWWLADVPDDTDLTGVDLSVGARAYLLGGGMSEDEVDALTALLTVD